MDDARRNRTSQLRLQARLALKSHNHNLKHDCVECQEAKERKRNREDEDAGHEDATDTEEEHSDDEEQREEEEPKKKKRKKKHELERTYHCHCSKFQV